MPHNGDISTSPRDRRDRARGRTLEATLRSKRVAQQEARAGSMKWGLAEGMAWVGRIACLAAITLFPWMRGGVSYHAQRWIGCLLLVALAAWIIETIVDRKAAPRKTPWLILPWMAAIGLGVVQLIPLSDGVASVVAPVQRDLLESFASPAGMPHVPPTPPTRISLDHTGGQRQLAVFCMALAGLFLGAHYFKSGPHTVVFLACVATNAALVAVVGMLQRITISGKTLIANEPVSGVMPFASFVNRNNAACFLLIGLAAAAGLLYWNLFREVPNRKPRRIISREIPVWRQAQERFGIFISELTPSRIACLLLLATISLGVVATLSRGGVLALLVGGLITTVTFGIVRDSESKIGWAAFAMVGVLGLALWLGFGSKLVERFDELNDLNAVSATDRIQHWSDTLPAVLDFGIFGSGFGSYHAVHRLYRTDLEERMFEHADNQYVETLIEGGWLGFGLLLAGLVILVWSIVFVSRRGNSARTKTIAVAGMLLITSVGIASITDFGVSVPANALLMSFFLGLITQHTHAFANRLKRKTWLRHELPALLTPVFAVCVVAGVGWATSYLHRLAEMERLNAVRPLREDYLSLNREQVERSLARLEPLVQATPTPWGYRRLGELHLHRYRLARFEELSQRLSSSPASLWQSTNLVSMHEQMTHLRRTGDRRLIEEFAASSEARDHMLPAWHALIASRNLLPLQSDVQLMLGQIQAVFGDQDKSLVCLDRALRAAPTNADFAYIIGLMHIQADRDELAASIWRTCVTLQPRYFNRVMERIHRVEGDRWRIAPDVVAETIVPDDPRLLAAFCGEHLQAEKYDELRRSCLLRADKILNASSKVSSDPRTVALEIQVKLGLGQKPEALNKMKWLISLSPSNMRISDLRFEMAQLMFELGLVDEAYEEIKWLRKNDPARVKRYSGLYEKLRLQLNKQPDEL